MCRDQIRPSDTANFFKESGDQAARSRKIFSETATSFAHFPATEQQQQFAPSGMALEGLQSHNRSLSAPLAGRSFWLHQGSPRHQRRPRKLLEARLGRAAASERTDARQATLISSIKSPSLQSRVMLGSSAFLSTCNNLQAGYRPSMTHCASFGVCRLSNAIQPLWSRPPPTMLLSIQQH